jgi:hypothetical protein
MKIPSLISRAVLAGALAAILVITSDEAVRFGFVPRLFRGANLGSRDIPTKWEHGGHHQPETLHPIPLSPLDHAGRGDTETLIDAIRRAALSGNAELWQTVCDGQLRILIERDPVTAAALAQAFDAGPVRDQLLRRVAQGWAAQDPKAALAWVAGLTDSLERDSALGDVCIQISQENPQYAISAATQYGLGNGGSCVDDLVQQWATTDAAAAFGWVSQLPVGSDRDRMMERVAFAVAKVSPAEAAVVVAEFIPPGPSQAEATISVLHQWGLQDFAAAANWVGQFPDGPLASRAKAELAGLSGSGAAH